ncbi:Golgi to ER traffic protein 4 [Nymphon striatum]|nr:Golgi to ER traffic protein 4 [Nymphon striatum]
MLLIRWFLPFINLESTVYKYAEIEEAFARNEADVSQGKTSHTFASEELAVEDCSEASQNTCALNGKEYLELSQNALKHADKKGNNLDELCFSLGSRTGIRGFLVVTSEVVGCPNTKKTVGKIYPKYFCCNDDGQLAVFTIICEKYETTLKRDPTYSQYLDRIGQLFFGVPPRKQNKSKGMIGNIINSLFQDLDESSGDEIFASSSNTQLHTEDLD